MRGEPPIWSGSGNTAACASQSRWRSQSSPYLVAGGIVVWQMFSPDPIEPGNPANSTVVTVEQGQLRGSDLNGVYRYLGVPYASATRRFERADAAPAWDGIRDATQTGSVSPQSGMLGFSAGSQSDTSVDCQNLNVWAPADATNAPVMVWLHGGGFSSGSANASDYDGEALARREGVVVVSVNHRLGVQGFLDLSAYGEQYAYSGNVGLIDIEDALRWIKANISAFGGDPANVTLFGQSGGGAKQIALMCAPSAEGLFSRAIVESGVTDTMGESFSTTEMSQRVVELTLQNLGLSGDEVDQLQTLPLEDIESAGSEALDQAAQEFQVPAPLTSGYAMEWGPTVGGSYLPAQPVGEDGTFAVPGRNVELLMGTNLNEWTRMGGSDQGNLTDEEMQAFEEAYPNEDLSDARYVDTLIRLPTMRILGAKAGQAASGGTSVYAYVMTYDESSRGAYHGSEIPLVFGHVPGDSDQAALSANMMDAWASFARTGVPAANGLPAWEPYTRDAGATMILDVDSYLAHNHDARLMSLLAPDYAW